MRKIASAWTVALVGLLGGLCFFLARTWSDEAAPSNSTQREFEGWSQPQVALFITGQQAGYIEPCGCTGLDNQKGGLARRHTLLKSLRDRGWTVVPLDAGNQVRRFGKQSTIKFQSTTNALRAMEYAAVGLGPDDLRLPVFDLIAFVAGGDKDGRSDLFFCANANPIDFVKSHRVISAGGMKIGVSAVLADELLEKLTQGEIVKRSAEQAIRETLEQLKAAGCDFHVLLAQASVEQCRRWARDIPGWHLIVSADGVGEPTYQPERVRGTQTSLIQAGAKGMYVGVVGLFGGPRPSLKYQRVALESRFTDSPEMMAVLADYQQTLQKQGLAELGLKPVRHPGGKFVGSQVCGECHTKAYAKWLETPHAHATTSIAEPTERSNIPRHFDPECLSCHVTGWSPQGYFPYETGYLDLTASAHLHGNGCENCHGPGHDHVAAENGEGNPSEAQIMNHRSQMRLALGPAAHEKCLECHDLDNSPDFHPEGAFEKYWEQIAHPGRD